MRGMGELYKIGVAGCGNMGAPMLAALRAKGFDAIGFDVKDAPSYGQMVDAISNDVQEFADRIEILISVVRDVPQTNDVLFGAQNLVERAEKLNTVVICSTLSPRYITDLRARIPDHIALVDAPMSGAPIGAEEARLSFMLGGDNADLDRLQPLFNAMGQHFHRMGALGAGMTAKVLNNMLAASSMAMTRLVLNWADELGVEEIKLLALIETSSGQNWLASGMETISFSREGYAPDNSIAILEKDVLSALDVTPVGASKSLPLSVIEALRNLQPRIK